jgi:hypothetical protein
VGLLALPLAVVAMAPLSLPFRSVVQGAPPVDGPSAPRVYLAAKPVQVAAISALVPANARGKVKAVDLSERAVVAVFLGSRPTGGFLVTVKKLTVNSGRLVVTVAVKKPGPGDIVIDAFTSPFHVVSVGRGILSPKPPSAWRLVDTDGKTLAAGAFRR